MTHFTKSSGNTGFDRLRVALSQSSALRAELESAMRLNVNRVNPSDPGNRFIVGGAVEWIVAATAWAAGVLTVPAGHSARGFDLIALQEQARGLWSVKAQTSKSKSGFRITNGLGGAGKGMQDDTLFVSPHLPGLVMVCPELHHEVTKEIQVKKDATVLPFSAIARHAAERPECVAPMNAPMNSGTGKENPFLAYTQTILTADQFPVLSTMFTDTAKSSSSVVGQIEDLLAMKASGAISEQQFDLLVAKIAGN